MRYADHEAVRLKKEGYREIIGYPQQFINGSGKIVDTFSGQALERRIYIDRDGNHIVTLVDENQDCENYEVGMLVALHFIRNPGDFKKIRHINGDRSNNNVYNIKWDELDDDEYALEVETVQEDDVRSKSIQINTDFEHGGERHRRQVYCEDTDAVYSSIGQAARELDLDQSTLSKALKRSNGVCTLRGFNLCYADLADSAEWEPQVYLEAINSVACEYHVFESIRDAAERLGLCRRSIANHVQTGKPFRGWIFKIMVK